MLDWGFVYENIPLYQQALVLTIRLALFGILGAIILGFFISLIKYYNVAILSQICQIYIELSRNTPLLIQLYFLYYGLPKVGVVLPSELCAIVGLIFLGGSYMAESFRSGLEAVSKRQYEVGLSIGLSHLQNVFMSSFLKQSQLHFRRWLLISSFLSKRRLSFQLLHLLI